MALIIFDYDGVLADTLEDLLRFGQQACDQLGVSHCVTVEDIADLEVMSFATYGRACGVPEPQVEAFVKICLSLFAAKASPPALFPGLGEVICSLSTHNQLAIVTTNTAQNVHAFLVRHGLEGRFQAIYGLDSPGSKSEKIGLARQQLLVNGDKAAVFMVGDALSDILAAHEANATSIAVTWGHQAIETLLRGYPDAVISTPHELVEVVER